MLASRRLIAAVCAMAVNLPCGVAPAAATGAASAPATTPTPAPVHFDLTRPQIAGFIDQQVAAGADRAALTALLQQAESKQSIIDAMNRPAEKALLWWEYRARFLGDERIDQGVRLWRDQQALLERVARAQRVSPEYIVAIIGVETFYGRTTGRYRVLDALATLAFDYPPRADFFRQELAQYLQLVREQEFDPLQIMGSYAGAMGAAQFMPSSYRKYAQQLDGSPKIDLWRDWGDIFASVGYYLHVHGWEYGGLVASAVNCSGVAPPAIPGAVTLDRTLGALRQAGCQPDTLAYDDTAALIVQADEQQGPGYRVGYRNFYVITRYNRSPLYAMAVADLAAALRARMYASGIE